MKMRQAATNVTAIIIRRHRRSATATIRAMIIRCRRATGIIRIRAITATIMTTTTRSRMFCERKTPSTAWRAFYFG